MQKTKKQHFVPQESLRRFSYKPGHVFVFDKAESKSYSGAISKTACQEYFYDLKTIDHDPSVPENFQIAEQAFCEIEEQGQPIIASILGKLEPFIDGRKVSGFSRDRLLYKTDKERLALFLVAQYLRTPDQREFFTNQARALLKVQANLQMANAGIDPHEFPLDVQLSREAAVGNHVSMALQIALAVAPALTNHIWLYSAVPPDVPLVCSDSPVILAPDKGVAPVEGGLLSPRIQIIFNLSTRINLTIVQRARFPEFARVDGRCQKAPIETAEWLNAMHLKSSRRYLYSRVDEFEWARDLLEKNPRWAGPVRKVPECTGALTEGVNELFEDSAAKSEYVLYWGRPEGEGLKRSST